MGAGQQGGGERVEGGVASVCEGRGPGLLGAFGRVLLLLARTPADGGRERALVGGARELGRPRGPAARRGSGCGPRVRRLLLRSRVQKVTLHPPLEHLSLDLEHLVCAMLLLFSFSFSFSFECLSVWRGSSIFFSASHLAFPVAGRQCVEFRVRRV